MTMRSWFEGGGRIYNALAIAILLCLSATAIPTFGQSAGDYRSRISGNWSDVGTWEYYTGSNWITANAGHGYPGQNTSGSGVQIRNTVTINVSPPRSIGSLQINGDQTLNSSGDPNLSVTGNVYLQSEWIWIFINIPIPSSLSFGNGNLSIGGTLTLDPACTVTFGLGNFTTAGTVYLDNYLFFPSTFQNNGTATLSNTVAGALSGGGEWTQGANSTLNYAGNTMSIGTLNASVTGNLVNYYRNAAQSLPNPSGGTYHHLTVSGSGIKASSGTLDINGNLTIAGTAQLDVNTGNDNINLAGDWNSMSTNADPFLQGSESVTLDGTTAQTITPSTGGETFYNLTINNSSAASPQTTVVGNVTVSNILTMDDGNVNLNGYTFTLTSTASGALDHNLNSASGWMYGGTFARARPASTNIAVGSAHSFFPLGSASEWRPFFAGQSNTTTAGTMTVTHTNSTSTSTVSISDNNPMPAVTIVRRHNSYWTPRTTATGGSYTLRAGGTNFGTISSNNHLQMATSTGTIVGARVAGSGSGGDWRVNRSGLTTAQLNANNFHLASTNAGSSPLPIELVSFSAQLKNDIVEINWKTASEMNNDYFTIERAIDIEHFEQILSHDGQGTSKELNHYKVMDSSPLYGRSYYRLKQTDFDGKFTYSDVRMIDYEGPAFATLTAFPNPVNTATFTLKIEGLKEASDVPVQILNLQGQKVFETVVNIRTPGIITMEISRDNFPSSGLYIIKAGNTLYLTKKIVVE